MISASKIFICLILKLKTSLLHYTQASFRQTWTCIEHTVLSLVLNRWLNWYAFLILRMFLINWFLEIVLITKIWCPCDPWDCAAYIIPCAIWLLHIQAFMKANWPKYAYSLIVSHSGVLFLLLFSSLLCVINLSKHQVTGTPRTWVFLLSHFLFSCMQKLRHRDHDDANAMGMLGWVLTVESQPWRRCSWVFKEIVLWHQFVKIGSREQKKKKKKERKKEKEVEIGSFLLENSVINSGVNVVK